MKSARLSASEALPQTEGEEWAAALLAAHLSTSGCGVTDREKAALYFKGEAIRRLDLLRQRAADAVAGPDPERDAIQAEAAAVFTTRVQPLALTNGLLRGVSPLAGTPGARFCRSCQRGIWCSPSWRGPPPDLCAECFRKPPP